MSKFEVNLPPALAEFVEALAQAGLYSNAEAAIEDAVRRLSESDGSKLELLRAALAPGIADIEAGRVSELSIEQILAEARASSRAAE